MRNSVITRSMIAICCIINFSGSLLLRKDFPADDNHEQQHASMSKKTTTESDSVIKKKTDFAEIHYSVAEAKRIVQLNDSIEKARRGRLTKK